MLSPLEETTEFENALLSWAPEIESWLLQTRDELRRQGIPKPFSVADGIDRILRDVRKKWEKRREEGTPQRGRAVGPLVKTMVINETFRWVAFQGEVQVAAECAGLMHKRQAACWAAFLRPTRSYKLHSSKERSVVDTKASVLYGYFSSWASEASNSDQAVLDAMGHVGGAILAGNGPRHLLLAWAELITYRFLGHEDPFLRLYRKRVADMERDEAKGRPLADDEQDVWLRVVEQGRSFAETARQLQISDAHAVLLFGAAADKLEADHYGRYRRTRDRALEDDEQDVWLRVVEQGRSFAETARQLQISDAHAVLLFGAAADKLEADRAFNPGPTSQSADKQRKRVEQARKDPTRWARYESRRDRLLDPRELQLWRLHSEQLLPLAVVADYLKILYLQAFSLFKSASAKLEDGGAFGPGATYTQSGRIDNDVIQRQVEYLRPNPGAWQRYRSALKDLKPGHRRLWRLIIERNISQSKACRRRTVNVSDSTATTWQKQSLQSLYEVGALEFLYQPEASNGDEP